MDRQSPGLKVLEHAKDSAEEANGNAQVHQRCATDPAQPVKMHPGQIGDVDIRLTRESAGRNNKCSGQSCDSGPSILI
jgi:hypothetical protein